MPISQWLLFLDIPFLLRFGEFSTTVLLTFCIFSFISALSVPWIPRVTITHVQGPGCFMVKVTWFTCLFIDVVHLLTLSLSSGILAGHGPVYWWLTAVTGHFLCVFSESLHFSFTIFLFFKTFSFFSLLALSSVFSFLCWVLNFFPCFLHQLACIPLWVTVHFSQGSLGLLHLPFASISASLDLVAEEFWPFERVAWLCFFVFWGCGLYIHWGGYLSVKRHIQHE